MLLKNRVFTRFRPIPLLLAALMVASSICLSDQAAEARSKSARSKSHAAPSSRSTGRTRGSARSSRTGSSRVVQYSGSKRKTVAVKSSRSSRGRKIRIVRQPRPKYAYPLSIFLMHAPSFDKSPLDQSTSERIARAWDRGIADSFPARSLVRAGIVQYHPLRGGIYYRREPVKYIILHSTETGIPVSAVNVIEGWSSMGRRHPGAQYVVDRDGTIYQAVDPDLATVHVNIFKTLPGINNDNSIGIEMNHTGRQNYPQAQREAVNKLLAYLQQRYQVENANVITHRYAQQGDHTDPVNFDLDGFLAYNRNFQRRALAYKVKGLEQEVKTWKAPEPTASTILQPHPVQVDAKETVEKKLDNVEKVKVTPLRPLEEVVRPVPSGSGLELKGPIEVDPSSATDLNQKEIFEVDGPGATAGGEASEAAKTKAAPESSTEPDTRTESKPESKLTTPSAPHHTPAHSAPPVKTAPAQLINQNTHKEPVKAVSNPAPKQVSEIPVKVSKPPAKKSMFQRMRAYLKENFQ
ncbi:MAG: hypothetical protein C0507_08760 [Cyanobacteria bacterium PR.3.49]|nr:hypothetical protein [Cyanobacteria bacterium PR.3.49]